MLKLNLPVFLGLLLVHSWNAVGANAEAETRTWVATISVQQYDHLSEPMQLQFCDNDAQGFVERMRTSKQMAANQVIEFRSDASLGGQRPTKVSIEQELPAFLAKPNESDTVYVFVSMHGLQIPQLVQEGGSGTYLLPSDFNPDDLKETTIDIQWLRDALQAGRARTTVLILDACHSGGIYKTEELTTVKHEPFSIKSVRSVFESPDEQPHRRSIYVLSSCGPAESSVEVPRLKHGIFTYWLLCGLDGAADLDHDTTITMDELFRFVSQHVPKMAAYFRSTTGEPYSQHPERFLCGTDHGDVAISQVTPTSVGHALQSLSKLVDGVLRPHLHTIATEGPVRIGVVELAMLNRSGNSELRGELGSFGRISRGELEKHLIHLSSRDSRPDYRLIPQERLQERLKGIDLASLNAGELAETGDEDLGHEASLDADALLLGTFLRRGKVGSASDPDRLQLELRLVDVRNHWIVAQISKSILINEELWSLLNVSIDRRQQVVLDSRRDGTSPTKNRDSLVSLHWLTTQALLTASPSLVVSGSPLSSLEKPTRNMLPHPLRDAGNKTISIQVLQGLAGAQPQLTNWLPHDPTQPNLLGFRTAKGMELTLKITNKTDDWLAYVVQIDGLNQIGRTTVLPSESPYWLAPPRSVATIDQWLSMPSPNGSNPDGKTQQVAGTRLQVTSPPQSLAGQSMLTDQLGEIRVLVFGTKRKLSGQRGNHDPAASLGIGEGRANVNHYPVYDNRCIDRSKQEATYIIRYTE